jgi:hypothetical protein
VISPGVLKPVMMNQLTYAFNPAAPQALLCWRADDTN